MIIATFNWVCDNAAHNLSDYVTFDYVKFQNVDAKVNLTCSKPS